MSFIASEFKQSGKRLGVLVLSLFMVTGLASQAMAAGDDPDAVGAVAAASTTTATDADGLLTTDYGGAATVNIDSTGGAIVLGAVATNDAITYIAQTGTQTMTVNVTTTGTNNLVTFAGDIEVVSGDEILVINATNTNTLFQGDITTGGGASSMIIGSGTSTLTTTFDTSTNANNAISMSISASAAADTITMAVTDTQGGGNTIAFAGAIGGGSAATAIDNLTLGANTVTTFAATVRADTITISSTNTTTFSGDITGNLNLAVGGTISLANGVDVMGNIDNTTGSDGAGTLALVGGTGVTMTGNIGSTNSLLAVNTDITGDGAAANTFTGTVQATTITITGTNNTDEVLFQDDVTGNIAIVNGALLTVTADKKFVGNITTTAGDGILTFATATVNTTLVSGTVGTAAGNALNTLNMATGAGITSTFASTVDALTITVSGTGTLNFTGAVQADTVFTVAGAATINLSEDLTSVNAGINFTAAGTVNLAADKKIVGTVAGGTGTLAFAATTTNTTLVSDTVSTGTITVAPASSVTATFANTVAATTVTHSGAGTLAYADTMTGITNISGGGLVTAAGAITGTVDNTGTTGTGTLTLGDQIGVSGAIGAANPLSNVTSDSTSGTTVFGGAVSATTITLGGVGNTTFAGTTTGAMTFTAAGTATIATDQIIVGSVATLTTDTGTLAFTPNSAVTTFIDGNVGSTTLLLNTVTAGSNGNTGTFGGEVNATNITITNMTAGQIVAFTGNVTGTALDVAANGTLNFAANVNLAGAITASGADGDGTLNFAGTGTSTITGLVGVIAGNELLAVNINAGIVTFLSDVAARTVVVAAGATFKTTGAIAMENSNFFNVSGTLDLGGTLTLTSGMGGTPELSTGVSTIILAPVSSYTSSVVIDGTAQNIDSSNTVTLVPDASFTSGTLTVVDTNGGNGTADNGIYTVTGNALASYVVSIDGSFDVILTATAQSSSAIAASLGVSEQAAAGISSASTALAGATSTQDVATQAAFNTVIAAGGSAATELAEQVQGSPDSLSSAGGATTAATGGQVVAVSSSRLASLRSGPQFASSGASGFSAGEGELSKALWMKPFVNFGDQDTKTGIAGFESETYGIAFGADVKVGDTKQYVIGISGSYANSDIDGKGAGRSKTDIDSYQVTLYGDYTADKYYIEAMFGYAFNETETSRTITAGALNPKGKYDSDQFVFSIGAGMPIQMAPNHFLTPNASFMFTTVSADTYTETGAGALNLTINQDDTNIALARFGLRYHTHNTTSGGTITPELRTNILYDMAGDEGQSTNTFTGAGAAFKVTGQEVAEFGYSVGGGLAYAPIANQGLTISANYDADFKEQYTGHSANFSLRYEF